MAECDVGTAARQFEVPLIASRTCRSSSGQDAITVQEAAAESIGTAMVIMFGNGVVAASALDTGDAYAKQQFINVAWGIGVALGIMLSYDISGAHLNPAVTLHALCFSGFPARKAGAYMACQFLGAFIGALVVTLDYVAFKGGDALSNFYCTSPAAGVSWGNAFADETVGTALLLLLIQSTASSHTSSPHPSSPQEPSKSVIAGWVGLGVFGIGNAFGRQSGYAINPARDLAPRLVWLIFAAAYGYGQSELWDTVMGAGYFFVPAVAPFVGALLGGSIHRLLLRTPLRVQIRSIQQRDNSADDQPRATAPA